MKEYFLKTLYYTLIRRPELASGKAYVKWLRKQGVKVGDGTIVVDPRKITVDVTRPELVRIGKDVLLHEGTVIMTHDYASRSFVNRYCEFIPSHGRITIGNNVWLGRNVTILKNVTIGDNVIIGLGAVVSKSIPSNSVAMGCPAKVVCTFDEYLSKRRKQYAQEAIDYALAIYESGRTPQIADFADDYPAFVDGTNYQQYPYPYNRVFTPAQFEQWKKLHIAPYHGFDEFMKAVEAIRNK